MKLSRVGLGISLVGIVLSGIGDSGASGQSAAESQWGEIVREGAVSATRKVAERPPENPPPADDRDGVQPHKRPPQRDRGKTDTQGIPDTEDTEETALAADDSLRERPRLPRPKGDPAPRNALPPR